jgi:hypothetical protein
MERETGFEPATSSLGNYTTLSGQTLPVWALRGEGSSAIADDCLSHYKPPNASCGMVVGTPVHEKGLAHPVIARVERNLMTVSVATPADENGQR